MLPLRIILSALLQKLVGEFFSILGREIWREIWWEFCGIFSDPQNKGSKIWGKISEHFSWENSCLEKKSFVPTSFCRSATLHMSKDGSIWQLFVLLFTIVWDTPGKDEIAKWSSAPASILEGFT